MNVVMSVLLAIVNNTNKLFDILMEVWKEIKDYEGLYWISNFGKVKSNKKVLSIPNRNNSKYLQIILYKKGKRSTKLIHRLVAESFISNPNNLPQVNHIDENPKNNHVSNLEWCTCEYNNNYGTIKARSSAGHKKPIIQLDLNDNVIAEFQSATDAANILGFERKNICACCNNKRKSANNFKWKFK